MTLERYIETDRSLMPFMSCERIISTHGCVIPLEDGAVHLWGCELDGTVSIVNTVLPWLDAEERGRAWRFVREEDRRLYVLAHGCLRAVLSRYIGRAPDTLVFERQRGGKPVLRLGNPEMRLTFNMAHSHGRMLVAVAHLQEVGADLEHVRAKIDVLKLAERFFTRSEHSRIISQPPENQAPCFFRHWVAKESILKGQGVGLPSLSECEVVPADDGRRATVRVSRGSNLQSGWHVQWVPCGAGWEGAVAFPGDRLVRLMPE